MEVLGEIVIGGRDSKAIRLNRNGGIRDFTLIEPSRPTRPPHFHCHLFQGIRHKVLRLKRYNGIDPAPCPRTVESHFIVLLVGLIAFSHGSLLNVTKLVNDHHPGADASVIDPRQRRRFDYDCTRYFGRWRRHAAVAPIP